MCTELSNHISRRAAIFSLIKRISYARWFLPLRVVYLQGAAKLQNRTAEIRLMSLKLFRGKKMRMQEGICKVRIDSYHFICYVMYKKQNSHHYETYLTQHIIQHDFF